MHIRSIGLPDIVALQAISRQTFVETFSDQNTVANMNQYLREKLSLEKLTAELNDPDSMFFFVEENQQPIGYLKLNKGKAQTELNDADALEIERIYVLQAYLGKNIGQLLFNKALAVANELGASYLWLGVWEENPRAIRFYEKNGFVEFDRHLFKLGDDEQTDIMMKLTLR
ncbi:MAG TPA: GNAT family N-acetyltransferase [Ferruginibacter sp.]|nr:GNAT family N-acetyltransferase [Ferruginibacter sp.]